MYSKLSTSLLLVALLEVSIGAAVPGHPKLASVGQNNQHASKVPTLALVDDAPVGRRDPKATLALRDEETFYYGDDATNPIAKVTGKFHGSGQHVVNMDRFAGMLSAVDCQNPNLMMDFTNKEDFDAAKESWSWVNMDAKNKFLMVANHPDCGPERLPYQVTDISYDEKLYKVMLDAHQVKWEGALPQWSAEAHTTGMNKHAKRGLLGKTKQWSPSLDTDFSQNIWRDDVGDVQFSLDCEKCGTGGSLDVVIKAEGNLRTLAEATVEVVPRSLDAYLNLALSASGTVSKEYEKHVTVFTAPLPGGIVVPFIELGPTVSVKAGAKLSKWQGKGNIAVGAGLQIPDDQENKMVLDLVHKEKSTITGFKPEFKEAIRPRVDASLTSSFEFFPRLSLDISATIFDEGFEQSIVLKAPNIKAEFEAAAGTEGALCDSKVAVGAKVHAQADVDTAIGLVGETPFWEKNIFSKGIDVYSGCVGIGPVGNGTTVTYRAD